VGVDRRRRRTRTRSLRRVWLTAYGRDLAQVATRVGSRIQLTPELVDLLSPACLPGSTGVGDR
jgi:hypothetical protein